MNLAFARNLTQRKVPIGLMARGLLGLIRLVVPKRRIEAAHQRTQQLRLQLLVAVRQQDVRHPIARGGGDPGRLSRRPPVAVGPRRHDTSLARLRDGPLQHCRSLQDVPRQALGEVHLEIHLAPLTGIGSRHIPERLDPHEGRQLRRGRIEDDQLPVARTILAQDLHLGRGRFVEADQEGDLRGCQRGGHLLRSRQRRRNVLALQPTLNMLGERRVITGIMRDDHDFLARAPEEGRDESEQNSEKTEEAFHLIRSGRCSFVSLRASAVRQASIFA